MPSPRKRKLKRAIGAVLTSNPCRVSPTPAERRVIEERLRQETDAGGGPSGADLVRGLKETLQHNPMYGGNSHKAGNIVDGAKRYDPDARTLTPTTATDLSAFATHAFTIIDYGVDDPDPVTGATGPVAGDFIRLTGANGVTYDFVFTNSEAGGLGQNRVIDSGDIIWQELQDENGADLQPEELRHFDPIRMAVIISDGNNDGVATVAELNQTMANFAAVVENGPALVNLPDPDFSCVQVEIGAGQRGGNPGVEGIGEIWITQPTAGPAGNTNILHRRFATSAIVGFQIQYTPDIRGTNFGEPITGLFAGQELDVVPGTNMRGIDADERFVCGADPRDAECFHGHLHRGGGTGVGGGIEGNDAIPGQEPVMSAHGLMFVTSPTVGALQLAADGSEADPSLNVTSSGGAHSLEPIYIYPASAKASTIADRTVPEGRRGDPNQAELSLYQKSDNCQYSVAKVLTVTPAANVAQAADEFGPVPGFNFNVGSMLPNAVAPAMSATPAGYTNLLGEQDIKVGDGGSDLPKAVILQSGADLTDSWFKVEMSMAQQDGLTGVGTEYDLVSNFRLSGPGAIIHWVSMPTRPSVFQ